MSESKKQRSSYSISQKFILNGVLSEVINGSDKETIHFESIQHLQSFHALFIVEVDKSIKEVYQMFTDIIQGEIANPIPQFWKLK